MRCLPLHLTGNSCRVQCHHMLMELAARRPALNHTERIIQVYLSRAFPCLMGQRWQEIQNSPNGHIPASQSRVNHQFVRKPRHQPLRSTEPPKWGDITATRYPSRAQPLRSRYHPVARVGHPYLLLQRQVLCFSLWSPK